MASYAQFFGRSVTVHYRLGTILIPAYGTVVGDSGRSIFLEQHLEIRGRPHYFRWEIPYTHIHKLEEDSFAADPSDTAGPQYQTEDTPGEPGRLATLAARASASGGGSLLPVSRRPKTA